MTYTAIDAVIPAVVGSIGTAADPTTAERVTSYIYDLLGRLVNVTEDATPSYAADDTQDTSYAFDLRGRKRAQLTFAPGDTVPNSVETNYLYDSLGRLNVMTDTDGNGNTLALYDYTVRSDGKRTSSTEQTWFDENEDGQLAANEVKANSYSWTYDDAGRLTDEVLDHWDDTVDQTEIFTYDLTGNRVALDRDKGNNETIDEAITYSYDANDRLLDEVLDSIVDTDDTTTTYSYDQTQQTSKMVVDAASLTRSSQFFTYNLQGRMASVTNEDYDASGVLNSRERTSYEYDASSFRVELTNESDAALDGNFTLSSTTQFLASHRNHTGYTQTLRETKFDADGNVIKTTDYTFGDDEISQTVTDENGNAVTHTFGHDGHGSVRVLYDVAGVIAQAFTFSAYGTMVALHNATAQSIAVSSRLTSLGYSGETFDAKVGQQYLRARFYNPSNGRFNRLDDFAGNNQDPQSFHKYAYVHGDPIEGIDPLGKFKAIFYLLSAANTIGAGFTHFQLAANFSRIESIRMSNSNTGSPDPSRKDKITLRWWHFFWSIGENTMVVQEVKNNGVLDVRLRGGRHISMTYNEHYVEAWTNPSNAVANNNRVTDQHQQRPPGLVLEKAMKGNFFRDKKYAWIVYFRDANGTLEVVENWSWTATVTFRIAAVPSGNPFGKFYHNRVATNVTITDSVAGNVNSTSPISSLAGPGSPWLRFPGNGRFLRAVDTYQANYKYGESNVTATSTHGAYVLPGNSN